MSLHPMYVWRGITLIESGCPSRRPLWSPRLHIHDDVDQDILLFLCRISRTLPKETAPILKRRLCQDTVAVASVLVPRPTTSEQIDQMFVSLLPHLPLPHSRLFLSGMRRVLLRLRNDRVRTGRTRSSILESGSQRHPLFSRCR